MKQIQGSVRVKIKEYVYALSEFLFISLLVNFFPQINHFYYFTSLHGLQDLENHCAHLGDIKYKTGRKTPYLRFTGISPFTKKVISSPRTVKILFLSFTCEDIGEAMVTNIITQLQ